jgi:hypothetical protein
MNLKIFQAYYHNDQLPYLDKEFLTLNNTANLDPRRREYPIFLQANTKAKELSLDYWGYVSWRWKQKLPGLTANDLLNLVSDNPGHDVYIFNPYAQYAVACINVWEQGLNCHPDIIQIMHHVCPKIGIDLRYLYQLQHPDTIYFGLYCVGNDKFWNGFLDLARRYDRCLTELPKHIQDAHESSARYTPHPDLGYFPFIHERLLTTYINMNKDKLKVFSYQHGKDQLGYLYDKFYFLKTMAIKYQSQEIYEEWKSLRKMINWSINNGEYWDVTF